MACDSLADMKMRSDLIEEFGEAGHNGGLEGLYVKFMLFEEYTFKVWKDILEKALKIMRETKKLNDYEE